MANDRGTPSLGRAWTEANAAIFDGAKVTEHAKSARSFIVHH